MNEDLYIILEACTSEELSSIVDTLVASAESNLKFARAYERYCPDHSKYADIIGDEVYRLGFLLTESSGDTRPSYVDLLKGIWRKIGISEFPDNIEELEGNLLNLFAEQHLLSVDLEDAKKVLEKACSVAEKAVGGLLSSNAWPPFAACLMKISYLRDTCVKEGRLPNPENNRIVALDAAAGTGVEQRREVALTSDEGDPLAIFRCVPEPSGVTWNSVGKIDDIVKYLSMTAAIIEPLMSAQALLSRGNYYRSDFALSIGKNGKHKGVAKGHQGMVDLVKVSAAGIGGPAAALIAIRQLEEQRRWENIERNLTETKLAVEGVSKFQKDERRTALTGSIRYFQQIAPSIMSGELAAEVLHGIERHEAELIRIQDHIAEDIKAQFVTLRSIKNEAWLSSSKFMKALDEAIAPLEALQHEMRLCLRARACGLQLLCAFPGREAGKAARRDDILGDIALYGPAGAVGREMDQIVREKAKLASSLANRMLILQRENAVLSITSQYESEIRKGMRLLLPSSPDEEVKIPIEFKVQDGAVVGYRTL
ncbi:hypothetical protein M527_23530 [Sphingobium indicum IP26]|nr:hypothetical protein M527_23530 [Sphingobium indicum IP26]